MAAADSHKTVRVLVVDDEPSITEFVSYALAREDLLRDAWGWEYLTKSKTVDIHIKRLRDKLRASGCSPKLVETVRGLGYRLHKE